MRFQKGMPRPANAGRKKGSKNVKKLKKVSQILAEEGIDPVAEILKLIESQYVRESDKLEAWFQLLSYCQAKPKEIDFDEDDGPSEDLEQTPTEALLKLVKDNDGAS